MENLLSKTPFKFKKSYGGTPEPLPPEYPPCRRGPSLKKIVNTARAVTINRGSYSAEVGGVFGTLTYPHLIPPYSAYYSHIESHYGGPWCSPITWCCN
jgi:hypothetical protein